MDETQLQVSPRHYVWRALMSWFYSSLSEDKIGEIVGCFTGLEIWEMLRRTYESNLPLLLILWACSLSYRWLKRMDTLYSNISPKSRTLLISSLPLANHFYIGTIWDIFSKDWASNKISCLRDIYSQPRTPSLVGGCPQLALSIWGIAKLC